VKFKARAILCAFYTVLCIAINKTQRFIRSS